MDGPREYNASEISQSFEHIFQSVEFQKHIFHMWNLRNKTNEQERERERKKETSQESDS